MTKQEQLERIAYRRTAYELIAEKEHVRYLLQYCSGKGRRDIDSAVSKRENEGADQEPW